MILYLYHIIVNSNSIVRFLKFHYKKYSAPRFCYDKHILSNQNDLRTGKYWIFRNQIKFNFQYVYKLRSKCEILQVTNSIVPSFKDECTATEFKWKISVYFESSYSRLCEYLVDWVYCPCLIGRKKFDSVNRLISLSEL